jgi:hypothetical protein
MAVAAEAQAQQYRDCMMALGCTTECGDEGVAQAVVLPGGSFVTISNVISGVMAGVFVLSQNCHSYGPQYPTALMSPQCTSDSQQTSRN